MTAEFWGAQGSLKRALSAISTLTAGALIGWLLTLYSISLLTLLSGYGIWRHAATVCLVCIPLWTISARDQRAGETIWFSLVATLMAAAVLGFSYWFASSFIDVSWDGTAYHQQAILQMVQGWPDFPDRLQSSLMYHQQLDHYPKAAWVIAASIYKASSSMEAAKLLHFVLLACAFLLLFGALSKQPRLPLWMVILVTITAALNPITIYQSLSFYVDGQLGSLLTITIGVILLMLQENRRQYLLILTAAIILTINIKQTGVVFEGLLLLALLGLIFFSRRTQFLSTLITTVLGVLIGLTLYGYSPYVTNTVNFGNPFYPILGRSHDFEQGHRPPGFDERTGVDRLLRSTFSAPTIPIDAPALLHAPFSLAQEQHIKRFKGADIRVGGWGVLFSGALLLSFLALPLLAFVPSKLRNVGLVLLSAIVVSVLINPEAWWARFAPQWYLAALMPGAILLFSGKLPVKMMGLLIVVVLLANSSLVTYAYYPQQREYTVELKEFLQLVKGVEKPIIVYFGPFPSNGVRLEEADIEFEAVEESTQLRCREPHEIFAYDGLFCVLGER